MFSLYNGYAHSMGVSKGGNFNRLVINQFKILFHLSAIDASPWQKGGLLTLGMSVNILYITFAESENAQHAST